MEDSLRATTEVADAVVTGVSDEGLGEVVGAAIVWKEGATRDMTVLADDLKSRLSAYKVPRVWISLEELPLIGPGKVDRREVHLLLTAERSHQRPVEFS